MKKEKVHRASISLDPDLFARAVERQRALGYASFSEYLQFLMTADVENEPLHVVTRNHGGQRTELQPQKDTAAPPALYQTQKPKKKKPDPRLNEK